MVEAIVLALIAGLSPVACAVIASRKGRKRSEAISAELAPNSGDSLRDAVDRIEARLEEHLTWAGDNEPRR